MRKFPSSRALAAAVLLQGSLCFTGALAQNLRTQTYTELDGLPSTSVGALALAKDGRLAFATRAGVALFDGVLWEEQTPLEGLPLHYGCQEIQFDDAGRLWVAGNDVEEGLAVLEAGEWQLVLAEGAALEGLEGAPWGLELLAHGDETTAALLSSSGRVSLIEAAGSWRFLEEPDGTPLERVVDLEVHESMLMVLTAQGLRSFGFSGAGELVPAASNAWTAAALPAGNLLAVRFEAGTARQRKLWVLAEEWLGFIEAGEFQFALRGFAAPYRNALARVLLESDGQGGVYLGSWSQVGHYSPGAKALHHLGMEAGLVAEGASDMLFDLAGNLWIATTRGVTRVPRQVFESFDLRQELLDDEVTAIFELTPGELILGQLRGLAYFDGEHGQVLPFDMPKGLSPRLVRVLDIQPSSQEGTLWIAAASLGAARLGPQGKLDWFGRDAGLECNSVLEDRQGQVWVATSRGLYQLVADPSEDPTPGTPVALPWLQDEPVRRLYQAPSGDLYIGTTISGLWRLRSEPGGLAATPESFSSAESEGANSIYSILELASGRVLVATRSGLFELAAAGLVRAPEARDLTRPVYSLLEDDAGRLWAGTSRGVERWEGGERRHYGVTQGLAGQETNRAAVLQDSQGQIWFGTDRGLSRYSERADSEPVDLVVQAVTMRSAGEVFHERHLPAHSDIEFDARLIYFAQDGARLRARLLGYESAWAPELSQGTRSVHYTNLPPGSYQLELQARRSRGTFGPSYFSSRVIIASPFYQQPWFFGLALLAGSLPLILSRTLIRSRRKSRSLGALADESAQALEESEQRYQEIFTRTSTVQLVLDTCNWAIQEANPAACDYFKRSPAEIEGRALSELTGVSSAFLASSAARLEDSGGEIVLRTRATLKDGEAKLELRLCQYMLRGQRVLHVVVSDISRNIRLEESLRESQKLRAVGELASGVAHDFNNLLAAIMGFSELVTYEEPENQAIRRHVGGITEASSRGAKLVRQLLTFSRQQRLDSEDMDLSSVVSDFSSLLRRLLDRNIEIICDLDPLAGSIHADKSQIETVLLYLALNARDAMPDGGQLTLRTRRIPAGAGVNANSGPQISLEVTDTGVGLDEETRMRIFEPFFSTKRNGTGMGLAEIHGIVGQSGGQIEVTSQPEEGTSFVILLPALDTVAAAAPVASDARSGRDPRAGKAPAQASGEADHGGAAMGALHILLVDDKEPVRLTVSTQLTSMGHRVHMSATGEEALAELQSAGDCFDLLLTDKSMPTISGPQLAERARELRPLLAVLLMSGFLDATEDYPELTILQKPFTMVELAQAIRVAVEEAKARGPKEGAATLDPEA